MSGMKKLLLLAAAFALVTSTAEADYVRGYYRKDGTYVRPHYRGGGSSSSYSSASTSTPTRFNSCAEARAAGYSNMTPGSPGYSSNLDRDGDGLACESGSGGSGSSTSISPSTSSPNYSGGTSNLYGGSESGGRQTPAGAIRGINYFAAAAIRDAGGTISQDDAKKYTIGLVNNRLTVTVGNAGAVLNGQYIMLNAAPIIHEGKLYLPAQSVYKLGCNLETATPLLMASCPNYLSIITVDVQSW